MAHDTMPRELSADPSLWATTENLTVPRTVRRRRAQGLRMPVLPSWPLLAQLGGAVATLAGVYAQFGGAIALMVGGVASVAVGALRESDRI